jgi:hypothetical protein
LEKCRNIKSGTIRPNSKMKSLAFEDHEKYVRRISTIKTIKKKFHGCRDNRKS